MNYIDESYQRSLQNHVKIITRDWNPTKCDPLKINFCEDGFKIFGFGYHIPFNCFGKWEAQHWSSNSYEYFIF